MGSLMLRTKTLVRVLTATAVGIAVLGAAAASASIVTVTYTGTAIGYDYLRLFLPLNQPRFYVTDPFIAVYTYNTRLGLLHKGSYSEYADGGSLYGRSSPITSATLTINGHSQTVTSKTIGTAEVFGGGAGIVEESAYDSSVYNYSRYLWTQVGTEFVPTDLETPFSRGSTGPYSYQSKGYFSEAGDIFDVHITDFLALTPDHVTVDVAAAVPEPATWSLMLLGFGSIGAITRSRLRRSGSTISI